MCGGGGGGGERERKCKKIICFQFESFKKEDRLSDRKRFSTTHKSSAQATKVVEGILSNIIPILQPEE